MPTCPTVRGWFRSSVRSAVPPLNNCTVLRWFCRSHSNDYINNKCLKFVNHSRFGTKYAHNVFRVQSMSTRSLHPPVTLARAKHSLHWCHSAVRAVRRPERPRRVPRPSAGSFARQHSCTHDLRVCVCGWHALCRHNVATEAQPSRRQTERPIDNARDRAKKCVCVCVCVLFAVCKTHGLCNGSPCAHATNVSDVITNYDDDDDSEWQTRQRMTRLNRFAICCRRITC